MAFSLDQFYRSNRRVLIWVILLFVLWLLRDFFSLIFLTFVISFLATPLVQLAEIRLRLGRVTSIVLVYLCFLAGLAAFVAFVTPALGREARSLFREMRGMQQRIFDLKRQALNEFPALNDVLAGYLRGNLPDETLRNPRLVALEHEMQSVAESLRGADFESYAPSALATPSALTLNSTSDSLLTAAAPSTATLATSSTLTGMQRALAREKYARLRGEHDDYVLILYLTMQGQRVAAYVPSLLHGTFDILFTITLALLFSFLIALDIRELEGQVRSLSASRLRDFYQQTAQPVVRFAYVVGRAIQAQAIIAVINTLLTLIAMLVMGIPSVALLSVIVFACSFVPVLGVFISTPAIALFALNSNGFKAVLIVVAIVWLIHFATYAISPLIYGRHLKINPVLVLIILFVAHHAFGMWGMILGVPVAHYFIHDVFGVPLWDEKKLTPKEATPLGSLTRSLEASDMIKAASDEPAARVKKD